MATAATLAWQLLTKVFETRKSEPFFLSKVLGAMKNFSPTDKVTIRSVTHGGGMADIGLRGDPANHINSNVTITETDREPPQIYEVDSVATGHLSYNYDPATMAILDKSSAVMRSFNYLYGKKADEMILRYHRRLEWMFSQILFTGEIAVSTDKRSFTHDFEVATPANYTLDSSADPLQDIGAVCEAYAIANGVYPNLIVTTSAIARAILGHSKTEKWISKNTFNFGNLKSQFKDPTTRFMGAFGEFAIPEIYAYSGSYANNAGTAVGYVPSGQLAVTNTTMWETAFAAQVDYDLDPSGTPIPGEIVVKEKVASDGKSKDLMLTSYPLPIIENGDAVKILNITVG